MYRELPVPVGEPMRRCIQQFNGSAVRILTDGSPEALASAQAQLARINGIFRLFGHRRAVQFCKELEAMLCRCSRGPSEKPSVRGQAAAAVLQLQHFMTGTLATMDDQVGVQKFPLPDVTQRVLEKIRTLQATLTDHEQDSEAHELTMRNQHLTDLASLLDVLGLPVEMRRLPTALVHLELHFRYLSECRKPCTAERLSRTDRLSADEYFLRDGRKSIVRILFVKIDELVSALSDIGHDDFSRNSSLQLRDAALRFINMTQALAMLSRCGLLTALNGFQCNLMSRGAALCRHIDTEASWRFSPAGSAREATLLLMRVSLSLQKLLALEGRSDRHAENLARKICRDCAEFVSRRQRELHNSMLDIHDVDCELIICANSEMKRCRLVILCIINEIETSKGFSYVSEALCTCVYKVSQLFLVTGQVACHEVVEELRESLTRGLEWHQEAGTAVLVALRALCERMQRPLSEDRSEEWCTAAELKELIESVGHCAEQMNWALGKRDWEFAATFQKDEAPQDRTPLAIEQLPQHLASNIHDLLFCEEKIALCARNLDDFEGMHRRLMVELRMLAAGAQALHVYRVARLSAVLAEVHQGIAGLKARRSKEAVQEIDLSLLVTAHRQLRSGLNQAAARQEVSSNREIIAGLYQCLEAFSEQPVMSTTTEGFTIFHREAEEIMSCIEEGVGKFSEDADASPLLNHLHTLKGNARVFGADTVATLCHRCEQTLMTSMQEGYLPAAIAESGRVINYASHARNAGPRDTRKLVPLVNELRAAVDELVPISETTQQMATIPLSQSHEKGIVIPAVALRRMEELAVTAKTGSGAMSDVLMTSRQSADSARLALLGELLAEQERCMEQLCEEIAGSTRISFSRLTHRLQRLVGRHANVLDKQVYFRVLNDEVYADRTLVESLVAPLEHLLRNAIDHGIEPVLERRARGKPDNGTITLALEDNEDTLVITMSDDGAGVDVDALAAHALRLGMEVDQHASEKERMQWLFLPGFSSKEQATEDSGHGIGLAQVGSTVAGLGGRVEVASTSGQGCSFLIVLPR